MRRAVTTAYIALREMFVERYCELESSPLNRLYEILNIQILAKEKPHLLNKSWLTVTTVEDGRLQYFVGKTRLNSVATILTEHQVAQFSPCQLLACLIADEAADTFWERKLITHDRFSTLEFQRLSSLGSQHKHWIAESSLFQDTSIAAREICTISGYCLLLNCPATVVEDLDPIASIAGNDLVNQFKANLKDYRGLRRTIRRLTGNLRRSDIYEELKDVCTGLIAKFAAEIVKQ